MMFSETLNGYMQYLYLKVEVLYLPARPVPSYLITFTYKKQIEISSSVPCSQCVHMHCPIVNVIH